MSRPAKKAVGKRAAPGRGASPSSRPRGAASQPASEASPPGRKHRRTEHLVEIGGRQLKLTNLEKVLYPRAGFTKADVIDYYARIAPYMLPHLKNRPITLKRFPDGVEAGFFYEKQCPVHRPDWVHIAPIESSTKLIRFCVIDDIPTLVWVANIASLEIHTYLAKGKTPDKPEFIAFDFDPGPPAGVLECIAVARRMRDMLAGMGLQSIPKVSGGKGLHVYVPLNTAVDFDRTKPFAREVAQTLERDDPKRVTSNMRKDLRTGKVFVDWSQNDRHKTTVCVYSLRARERPTVSMPVAWDELEAAARKKEPSSLVFEAGAAVARAERVGDLFGPVLSLKQRLPAIHRGSQGRKTA
jgi:bifunctional non-homologous end joining protein LigD